ncbi:hypothetical protein [Fodinicola acaciae]|uniref:hypothetical protein n=1 Tax=Fodinicola acaciae TaxID=2681555 RepID=UPI0013D1FDC8|nr:hypothetical protein [Fodinicola acaciae]
MIVAIILGAIGLIAAFYALSGTLMVIERLGDWLRPKWEHFIEKNGGFIFLLVLAAFGGVIGIVVYVVSR